ncbi:MAG: AAA family ATPase [Aerococcus sp.]|nr:AAA family ATPase [Aerococcus sp.]
MNITHAKDLTNDHVTYLIYGKQGVGKTSSLKSLPGKTLVIDIDHSSVVLQGQQGMDIYNFDSSDAWQEWLNIASELVTNPAYSEHYDNLVIDNITELFRSSLENLGKNGKTSQGGVPAQSDYQKVDFMILRAVRELKKLPMRLIFTAWEKEDQYIDESGQTFNRAFPDLRHTIANNFMGLTDVIAHLIVINKEGELHRGFILQPDNHQMAKNRLDDRKGCKVDELWSINSTTTNKTSSDAPEAP